MKYLFFCIAVLSIAITGCKSDKQKAIELNNKLASINDSLYKRGVNLGVVIRTSSSTHDFSKIAQYGSEMETFIDAKIVEVNKLENVAGSDKYKDAVAEFLNLEESILSMREYLQWHLQHLHLLHYPFQGYKNFTFMRH